MNNRWRRLLSLLLAMVMVLSLGVTGFADAGDAEAEAEAAEKPSAETEAAEEPAAEAEGEEVQLETEDISPDTLAVQKLGLEDSGEPGKHDLGEIVPMEGEDLDTVVRASIFLEKPSTMAAGYSARGIAENSAAMSYRSELKAEQDAMTARIESVIGHELNVHWNLTLAVNAISADLTLAEMVKIQQIPGVRSVQRENQYLPMEEGTISDPNTANTSENMVGATASWAAGYTGAGSKIAIIDTGIDTTHQSFAADPFTYAIGLAGANNELLTKAQVSALASQLNSKSGNYVSAKIPYGYNYVDGNTTIDHNSDTQGNHGSHVAGIAAANRYIGSAHNDAITAVGAVGMAPDAQLLVMKVFGAAHSGASDSDYMVAIEDAAVLGADVCNLSLGSGVQGWTVDNNYQDVILDWANGENHEKMVLSISAGNAYDLAYFTDAGNLYTEDVSMHTGGSPGTALNSLCVASADNTLSKGTPMLFNGSQDVFYYESTGDEDEGTSYSNPPLASVAGSYNYVYIDATGKPEDYSTVNAAMSLSGKVVIVNRGDIDFSTKGENAKGYQPKALIVANNTAGAIYMQLPNFTGSFPMVTITKADAEKIKAGGTAHTVNGIPYYTGSVKVINTAKTVVIDRSEASISEFSSWGVPGSLIMKPEITAPGGDIYSVNGTNLNSAGSTEGGADAYVSYSGTSMAAPHIAGLTAVLAEALRENPMSGRNSALANGYSTRAITQSLLMSTATPMAPSNSYLSILQQGAGLADVNKAITSNSVVMMDPAKSGLTGLTGAAADGKVKVELGDDPDREGDYSFGFTVYNLSGDDLYFTVNTDVFTQASDGEFMLRGTAGIGASATYKWAALSGGTVTNKHDVNRDGVTNSLDAQAILDYLSGEAGNANLNLSAGEMDNDGTLSSQDAYQLLRYTEDHQNETRDGLVPAHGSRYCTVRITLPEGVKDSLNAEFPGGAYLEGFTTLRSKTITGEGAVYADEHSIPILGFFGSWTDAGMFETTSYAEQLYGNEQLPYAGNADTNYLKLKVNGSTVKFSGNPYKVEGSAVTDFPAERLAISSSTNIESITYTLIRAAADTGFAVSKLDDKGDVTSVLSSSMNSYPVEGIWHSESYGWQNLSSKNYSVGKTPASYGLKEGDRFRIGFYAIPEYAAMKQNQDYTSAEACMLSTADFNSLLTANALGKGAFVGYDFIVDSTVPSINGVTLKGSTLTVKAEDNQNLAYLAVMSLDGATIYKEVVPAVPSWEMSLDVSDAIANAKGYVAVFAGDYAGNEKAVAVKVNDKAEGNPYSVTEVTMTPTSLELYKGSTADLSAQVLPMTATDRSVTWSSSNPGVAKVDQDGKVTAVSAGTTANSQHIYSATARIRATSKADSSKYAECTVTVKSIEKALHGIVWDEAGQVFFSSFNTNTLPSWTKQHSDDKQLPLQSAFQNTASALYAATLDTSTWESEIYTVNQSSFALTDLAPNYYPVFGMARASTSATIQKYFVYGFANNLIFGNLTPEEDEDLGTFSGFPYGFLDLSSTDVGDAYVSALCAKSVGTTSSSYYFLDENGKIWQVTMTIGSSVSFGKPTLVMDTGISAGLLYQSLYYDKTYLYWSHMTGNETEMIIIVPSTKQIYHAGNFGEGIWPVGGLFVKGSAAPNSVGDEPMTEPFNPVRVATREDLMTPEVIERLSAASGVEWNGRQPAAEEDELPLDPDFELEEAEGSIAPVEPADEPEPVLEPAPAEGEEDLAYTGSLTAFRGVRAAAPSTSLEEPQAAANRFSISVAEKESSHNGLIAVKYDPTLVSFVSWTDPGASSNLSVHADAKGVIRIAYANKGISTDDIDAGTAIVKLVFEVAEVSNPGCGGAANVTTLERNGKLKLSEQSDVILPGCPGHAWGQPTWTWKADCSSAVARFVCSKKAAHTASVDATVTSKTSGGVTTYTATALFNGKTYTDTRKVSTGTRPAFKTHSLRLSGSIAVNFFLDLPTISGVDWSKSYMTFTVSGKEIRVNYDPSYKNASGKYYGFDCPTNSIQMAETITAVFHYGNGLTVAEDYSIKQYMQVFQANENLFDAKTRALIRSIADYGHYVQPFLAAENKWVVGEDYAEMDLFYTNSFDINAVKAAVADYAIVRQTSKDISAIGYALALDSGTDIRVYFKLAQGYSGSLNFAVDGEIAEGKLMSDGRYMVVVPAIPAHRLGKTYTVTAKTDSGTATAKVSALSYVQGMLASSPNQVRANAMAALYSYFKAASEIKH